MNYLKSCVDYEILKKELDNETLNEIEKVIEHFENYVKDNDDGYKDIIGEYYGIYGNYYIIDWYEGLIDTKEFLEHIEDI